MANRTVLSFPEKKKPAKKEKGGTREKLSEQLLQELRKDDAYREFTSAEEVYGGIGESLMKVRKARRMSVADLAGSIGKKETIVLRMEKGEYKQYTMKLLLQLAHRTNSKLRIRFE